MGKLSGKVAIVTGGASGMGRATVMRFLGDGAKVVVGDLNEANGAETVAVARAAGHGESIAFLRCDVSREADVAALVSDAVKRFGRLDILVNNAGMTQVGGDVPGGRFAQMTEAGWDYGIDINLKTAFLGCKYAIPLMLETGGGAIVNLSSVAARLGAPGQYVDYAASKGAIDTFNLGLAKEVAAEGIRVNAVRPGIIDTDIHASGGIPDRAKTMAPMIPMLRPGSADEVAQSIVWLLSDAASYVTGANLEVTGGR